MLEVTLLELIERAVQKAASKIEDESMSEEQLLSLAGQLCQRVGFELYFNITEIKH